MIADGELGVDTEGGDAREDAQGAVGGRVKGQRGAEGHHARRARMYEGVLGGLATVRRRGWRLDEERSNWRKGRSEIVVG